MLLRQSEVEKTYRFSKTTLHRWLKNGKLSVLQDYRCRLQRRSQIFNNVGCTVEVLEEKENKGEHEELVEDILTIIVSFSSRIYGKRSRRRRKEVNNVSD